MVSCSYFNYHIVTSPLHLILTLTCFQASEVPDPSSNVTVTVLITVIDQNDNPPIFSQKSYSFKVRENLAKPGRIVTDQLIVTDADKNVRGTFLLNMLWFEIFLVPFFSYQFDFSTFDKYKSNMYGNLELREIPNHNTYI